MLENCTLSEIQNGLSLILGNSFLGKECLKSFLKDLLSLLESQVTLFKWVHNVKALVNAPTVYKSVILISPLMKTKA